MNSQSLVIDCGANLGDISAIFLRKKAKIIAFEPDPLAFSYLSKRFNGNQQITCINKAVSDREGNASFYLHKERNKKDDSAFTVSSSLVKEKKNVDNQNVINIHTIDLDKYINDLEAKVDVLKLDVEGAEIDILHKLINNETYKKVGLILAETHENKIPEHGKLVDELKKLIKEKKINNIRLNWI